MTKVLYVPGWMDVGHSYGLSPSLDIWDHKIDWQTNLEAEYLVAYSAGAIFALLCWQNNPKIKLVLVNPLVPRRSIPDVAMRWVRFIFSEGVPLTWERIKIIPHIFRGIALLWRFTQVDTLAIIKLIPRDRLVVFRGSNDKYLFNETLAKIVEDAGVEVVNIEGAGHIITPKLNETIRDYIYAKGD